MNVALLIIGSEILSGRTQDRNVQVLAKTLGKKGLALAKIVVIKDELTLLVQTMQALLQEFNLVITSGGLGPTKDDMTKEALVLLGGGPLVEKPEAAVLVTKHYERFGREWNKTTNSYHLIPKNVTALENPSGMAPGLLYQNENGHQLICLPGVPREFKDMAEQIVCPLIEKNKKFTPRMISYVTLRTFAVPEEKIFFTLCPGLWADLENFGEVSSLPHTVGVDILVKLNDPRAAQEAEEKIKKLPSLAPLLPHIWQWGDLSFEACLQQMCLERKIKIAVAESCTGGFLSHKLTNLPGASQIFLGGLVSYDNSVKNLFLGVQAETLKNFGAVHLETAKEMAQRAREKMHSDYALSTTGVAGPGGGSVERPVGLVCIGIAGPDGLVSASSYQMLGSRETLKERFSDRALLDLILCLKSGS